MIKKQPFVEKPMTRRFAIWMLNEFRPEKGPKDSPVRFESIVRAIQRNDVSVRNLFKFAGTDYREIGNWYPLIGLLAELLSVDAISKNKTSGRRAFWSDDKLQELNSRFIKTKDRFPKRNDNRVCEQILIDDNSFAPGVTAKTLEARATTLARRRRDYLRRLTAGNGPPRRR
jgi:hypothetical protein